MVQDQWCRIPFHNQSLLQEKSIHVFVLLSFQGFGALLRCFGPFRPLQVSTKRPFFQGSGDPAVSTRGRGGQIGSPHRDQNP